MTAPKKTTASEEHARIFKMLSDLTANMSMVACADFARIQEFEKAAKTDPLMFELISELRNRLAAVRGPDAFIEMSQAYEAFAEANFAFEMLNRGIHLQRTPGTGGEHQRRPDFVHHHQAGPIYFELKALEISNPTVRNRQIAEDALQAAANLEERARKPGVHFGEIELPGFEHGMSASARVDLVVNRLNNALKRDQLRYGPTILVVDLGRLPGMTFGPSGLLPVFFHDAPPAENSVSGELWHIALGRVGEQMFKLPEFDGASNLDGHLTKDGLLRDYPELCGVMFVYPRWSAASEMLTISNKAPDQANLVHKLTLPEHDLEDLIENCSDGWNDSRNEQGWFYRILPLRPKP